MRISVIIPLYNKKESITTTLESVFGQTLQPEEVIVVNDGSTDGSEKIVKALNHPLVKLVNQSNMGVSSARNKGIEQAVGDWISFLDADDIWMSEYLERIIILHNEFPECKILASSYLIQNKLNIRKEIVLNRMPFAGEYGKLNNYFEVSSVSHPPIWSSAVVVEKDILKRLGGFPPGVRSGEDLLTWAKLASESEIAYLRKPLSVFIQDDEHSYFGYPTRIPQEPDIVGSELITLARNHPDKTGIREYVSLWFKMRSSVYLRFGMKRKAFLQAVRSLVFNPLNYRVYAYLLMLPLPLFCVHRIFRKLGNA